MISQGWHLTGTVVMVKCDKVDKVVTATTGKDGFFEAELHPSSDGRDCEARLAGRPNQIYSATNTIVAGIVRGDGGVYGISTPLAFCTACRSISSEAVKYCKAAGRKFGSSKTFNLPLPPEWGLAPSSYYFPFFPIIGVP
ncbi:uncharacterized protein LOC111020592 isoform X2 [Momordica charantia]|uniref:Uncharacterized protein LOC111020592 isoform X2 n=1 Tax=Momordica charantia TaxID=3673 RepID=A0A6J1DJC9_MOMCH|nr:uncharacterized protein LOC111020592 isoform X2 [Momordica charantia]